MNSFIHSRILSTHTRDSSNSFTPPTIIIIFWKKIKKIRIDIYVFRMRFVFDVIIIASGVAIATAVARHLTGTPNNSIRQWMGSWKRCYCFAVISFYRVKITTANTIKLNLMRTHSIVYPALLPFNRISFFVFAYLISIFQFRVVHKKWLTFLLPMLMRRNWMKRQLICITHNLWNWMHIANKSNYERKKIAFLENVRMCRWF